MKEPLVQRLVDFSVRRSWIVILITAILSLFLGYHALHIQADADIFNMIPRKTKVIEDIDRYSTNRDTGQILIAVEGRDLARGPAAASGHRGPGRPGAEQRGGASRVQESPAVRSTCQEPRLVGGSERSMCDLSR